MNTGERIKILRSSLGLTQKEFAERLGVSQPFIGNVEKGRANLTFDHLVSLWNVFAVDLRWLFTGEGRPTFAEEARVRALQEAVARIVAEGNEKKIKAVESQLAVLDPGEN